MHGLEQTMYPGTKHICTFGNRKMISGEKLLAFCTDNNLILTNTMFETSKKTTWMRPRFKHWHQIDFIVNKSDVLSDERSQLLHRILTHTEKDLQKAHIHKTDQAKGPSP